MALTEHARPVGIAHAIRAAEHSASAEVAVAVVDALQSRGIGTSLVAELARRAVRAGIERFDAAVLVWRSGLVEALTKMGWTVVGEDQHNVELVLELLDARDGCGRDTARV